MSVNYSGYVIYGKTVNKKAFEVVTEIRGCLHPDSGSNFCPECGKKTWEKTTTRNIDEDDYLWEHDGLGIMQYKGYYIIGKIIAMVSDYCKDECDMKDITNEDIETVKGICEKYNIPTNDLKTKLYMVIQ